MRRTLSIIAAVLLTIVAPGVANAGWFFVTVSGTPYKADFHTQIACEQARVDVATAMGTTIKDRRIQPCRPDPQPPVDFTGVMTQAPGKPPVKP